MFGGLLFIALHLFILPTKYFRFSTALVPEREGVYRTVLGCHSHSNKENPHTNNGNENKEYLFDNSQNGGSEANENPTYSHPAELVNFFIISTS